MDYLAYTKHGVFCRTCSVKITKETFEKDEVYTCECGKKSKPLWRNFTEQLLFYVSSSSCIPSEKVLEIITNPQWDYIIFDWKHFVPQFYKDEWENLSTDSKLSIFDLADRQWNNTVSYQKKS